MSSMYPLLTKCVILAKYWLWLPDDGFLVNRNMLEQFYFFLNVLITMFFYRCVRQLEIKVLDSQMSNNTEDTEVNF